MDRIRELHKSRSSTNKIRGNHKDKAASKLASPNVVAKLMGLEGFPPPEVIHIPQKTLFDDGRQNALPRMSQREAHLHDEFRSYKKNYVEQPEFKDVYEDTIRKSGSDKSSSAKLPHQPDSLFLEHLHMLKSPSGYRHNHIAVLKPSNSAKTKPKTKGLNERESPMKDDFVRHTYRSHGSESLFKPLNIATGEKRESDIMAKRIVILKPNYVKAQNACKSFSSPDSSQFDFSVYGDHEQYKYTSRAEYCFSNLDNIKDIDLSRSKSKEITETVKRASREMRDASNSIMMNRRHADEEYHRRMATEYGYMMTDTPSPIRGSPDMRSLYKFTGNVSASKSEAMKFTSYDFTESFASNEAKKKLFERLKKAHKYEDVGVVSKGRMPKEIYENVGVDGKKITLGEMLSTSDLKIRNLDVSTGGISSRDGWNGIYSKFSSRSRSVHPVSTRISEKNYADGENRVDDKLLMPKDTAYQYQRKVIDKNCEKENSTSRKSRSGKSISQSDRPRYAYKGVSLLETYSSQDQMEATCNKNVSSDEQPVVPDTPDNIASIVDAAGNIQHGCRTPSPRSSVELPPELSMFIKKYDYSAVGNPDDSTPQGTKAEAESSESTKEADHPSPVSVLEVPPREDDVLSGPESFEQVSADLRELQKQLQLLRRESKSYVGASTLVHNDTDVQEGPVTADNISLHQNDCWESSYMIDVLIESGFDDTDAHMFMAIWYSPDCPLGPWVFDNLENKHYSEVTELKHDRRLLFDRINSALSEILKSFMESCPWVRPSTIGIRCSGRTFEIRDELYKLLEVQEKEANESVPEKLLDKEMNWVDSRESIDVIGMEIEKLITDELLTELVNYVGFSN